MLQAGKKCLAIKKKILFTIILIFKTLNSQLIMNNYNTISNIISVHTI